MAWQEIVLAVVPKITSTLSIFGSVWIVGEVWFSHEKRFFVYHKLLLRMALYDILVSIWYFASTWPLPDSSSSSSSTYQYQEGARGTDTTCQIQGFFIQLHIANAIYFCMLGVYYMLVITYSYTEERLKREHWETLFHWIPFLFSVGTSVAGVPLGLYHPDELWCWIADAAASSSSTSTTLVYQWAFSFGPIWTCFLIMLWALRNVFLGVKSQEQRMKKYITRPSISYTITSTTREEDDDAMVVALEACKGCADADATDAAEEEDSIKPSSSSSRYRCYSGCRFYCQRGRRWIQQPRIILRIQNYWEHLPRTRQVMSQICCYAGAFFISQIFTLIVHLVPHDRDPSSSTNNQSSSWSWPFFGVLVLQAIFQPLQGFLIFLSYRRPTYLRFRGRRHKQRNGQEVPGSSCSRLQAAREALKWDLERKLNRHTSQKPYRGGRPSVASSSYRGGGGGGQYPNNSRGVMRRISETILGGSGGTRHGVQSAIGTCSTSRRSSILSTRNFWGRTGGRSSGADGADTGGQDMNSESSTTMRVQDYSTGQHENGIQLSMSSPDGSKNMEESTTISSSADLGASGLGSGKPGAGQNDSYSTITTTQSSSKELQVVPNNNNKRPELVKDTSLRFEDLVEDIEQEVRGRNHHDQDDDTRNNRSTREGDDAGRESRAGPRPEERSRRDFEMILETSRQFMNLVGMDIIPEADGNTEDIWRELFGSSKEEFQENNDGHRSMPTMMHQHATLSRQTRGAPPSKAQVSRLNPFVWTRQALPFVFGARPEPVEETEAAAALDEEAVTTPDFDRNVPGRSASGGYFVRQVNPQTPDNRFWARLELEKKRKEIMKTITKNRFSNRNLDLNQVEPGELDSSSLQTTSPSQENVVVADSPRVKRSIRSRDALRAPKRSGSNGYDDIQEEESRPNQPDEAQSLPPVDNNKDQNNPNEGSLRGILRSISKNRWSNRKLGDITDALSSEHENSHTSFHIDAWDAIERGVNPTNQSSDVSSSTTELSLVSHDSTLKTSRRSNMQGERSETSLFSNGELFGSNEMDYVSNDEDISCDDISLVSDGPIDTSEELDDDDDDDDEQDDKNDDNDDDEDNDEDAGGSSNSSLLVEDDVFEKSARLDQSPRSAAGEGSQSSGIWKRLEEAQSQQDKLRDILRSIQQASSSSCGNLSVPSPPPSPRKTPKEKDNDDIC